MNGKHAQFIAIIGLVALLFVAISSIAAVAATQGTPHDFRTPENGGPNKTFANLGKVAGKSACKVCHSSSGMVSGQKYMWGDDYGWQPVKNAVLPESVFCMGCHDGSIVTQTGTDKLPDPAKMIANHKHPMESKYAGGKGFAKLGKSAKGKPVITTKWNVDLPLFVDEEGDGDTRITCLTCHNPHELGKEQLFLRVPSKAELCKACHV